MLALGRLSRSGKVAEALSPLAAGDPDPEVRALARAACDQLAARQGDSCPVVIEGEDPTADVEAVAGYLQDPDPRVRMEALIASHGITSPGLLTVVMPLLATESNEWVLALLIREIGRLGNATLLPRIQRFLNHSSRGVVCATIEAITTLDPESGFTLLVPLLKSTDSAIRAEAVGTMYEVERRGALDTLANMAQSPHPNVRRSAVQCLARLDDSSAPRLLADMLIDEVDAEIAGRIERHLAEKGTVTSLVSLAVRCDASGSTGWAGLIERMRARLGLTPEELAAKCREARPAPLDRPAESPVRARQSARIYLPRKQVPKQPPPAAGRSSWPWPASLLAEHPLIAAASCAGAILLLVCLDPAKQDDPTAQVQAVHRSSTTLETIARSSAPASFVNQVVQWDAVVQGLDVPQRTIVASALSHVFSITCDTLARLDLHRGDKIRVTGRVVGRSRFGPVYLQALEVRRL